MDASSALPQEARSGCVAITGATGFIGRSVARELLHRHWRLRALVRRPAVGSGLDMDVVAGSMEDGASLRALVEGASVVVHCAGLVRARHASDFRRVNAEGTARLLAAVAEQRKPPRVLLISSLAAREPRVSAYATSKREAEGLLAASPLEHCIVRPPAVYGPGDEATLPLFRLLTRRVALLPGTRRTRFSLIFVDDLASAVAALVEHPRWNGNVVEPDDRHPRGYSWRDLAAVAEQTVGRRVRPVLLPRWLLRIPAALAEAAAALLGRTPVVTPDKLGELYHEDWVCRATIGDLLRDWRPSTDFRAGFRRTLGWYVEHGWLK